MSFQQDFESKRKYSRISIKKRQNLVSLVIENQQTIACAARRLGLKPSTARMILNKYKKTGTYPMKNFKKSIKATFQKASIVKQEDDKQEYRVKFEDDNKRQESLKQQVFETKVGMRPAELWLQVLMMVSPFQAFYFASGLSYQ